MTRFIATTTAIAATALFATSAHAGEMKMDDMTAKAPQSRTTVMVKTIDADNQVSTVQMVANTPRKTAVLGAFAEQKTDAYIVEDTDGELYINHLLPVSELPDPTLEVTEVDRYTTQYRGMTFTNRIVAE